MMKKAQAVVLALMLVAAPDSRSLAQAAGNGGGGANGLPGAGNTAAGSTISGDATTGAGATGAAPHYGGSNSNSVETPTGNAAGPGTGLGIGSTTTGQPATQSSIGAPNGPSTTPGGPPTPGTSNMTGTGAAGGR
ncbi:MAG: hypothetical protein ACJ8AI_06805 [Rhodopila sp.]|jgi:hypothetical protein